MTESNVDIARRGYEAYNRDGPHAILDFMHPDIEWHTPQQDVAGTFHGHDGVRRFLDEFFEIFESAQIDPEEFIEAGDRLVVSFRFRATARGSGMDLDERWAHVWTIREGKAVRLEQYTDPQEAFRALGLSH